MYLRIYCALRLIGDYVFCVLFPGCTAETIDKS